MKNFTTLLKVEKFSLEVILRTQSKTLPEGFTLTHATRDMANHLAEFRNKGAKEFKSASYVTIENEIRNIESFTAEDAIYIVLEHKGSIVGAVCAQIQNDPVTGMSVYISKLLVLKEFNGKGFATALMTVAEKWGASKGIMVVILSVYADNKTALRLYEHSGFKELEKVTYYDMVKRL